MADNYRVIDPKQSGFNVLLLSLEVVVKLWGPPPEAYSFIIKLKLDNQTFVIYGQTSLLNGCRLGFDEFIENPLQDVKNIITFFHFYINSSYCFLLIYYTKNDPSLFCLNSIRIKNLCLVLCKQMGQFLLGAKSIPLSPP